MLSDAVYEQICVDVSVIVTAPRVYHFSPPYSLPPSCVDRRTKGGNTDLR
jgi:hypothetical protein